jgi:hypothetical protein
MLLAPLLAPLRGLSRLRAAGGRAGGETAATAPQPTVTRPPDPAATVPARRRKRRPRPRPLAPPRLRSAARRHRRDKAYAQGWPRCRRGHERALDLFAAAMKKTGVSGASGRSIEALVAGEEGGGRRERPGKTEEAGRRRMAGLRQFQHPAAKGKT